MEQTISVIVPVYNCRAYLERCIESILGQSYPYIQLVLIDDGSTDGSGEVCDVFAIKDGRVQVIHQENRGVSAARNAGIRLAKGKYLTFVDADDTLVSDAMEVALGVLQQNQADMVTYGWNIIREDGSAEQACGRSVIADDIPGVVKEVLMHYSAYGGGYPWNKLWRRDVFSADFPVFNSDLYYFEDLEWVVRMLLEVHRIVVLPECLYNYYLRKDSVTHSAGKAERREIGYHDSIKRIIEDLSVLPEVQIWFAQKYYPEIANGVIYARRNKYRSLQKLLLQTMLRLKEDILFSDLVSHKVKLRCRILCLLDKINIL